MSSGESTILKNEDVLSFDYLPEILPHRELYLLMGGFHLSGSSDSELINIVQGFRNMGIHKVAPSHCSGDRCRELFKEEYQEDYIESGVGRIIVP